MKILINYLKPHKLTVSLVLFLAAINIGFSMMDPIIFGHIVNLAADYQSDNSSIAGSDAFFWNFSWSNPGVLALLVASITVAMISRIAKNFQDYFLNVITQKFGAAMFTDGLQHA
ncbi:MAG: ABC transporter ATP-binding protein, partial [Chitinophagales bacterium]